MVYAKLELNATHEKNASVLQNLGRFVLKLFRLALVISAFILLIKVVALNTAPRTYPLTDMPSIGDENGMQFAFWLSLLVSFFSAQAKTTIWYKKLLHIFGFFLACILMSMLVLMTLSDFNERRLFSRIYAPISIEAFRVIEIEVGRKGNRKAIVASPKYDLKPEISIERSAYDFLETLKGPATKTNVTETSEHSRAELFNRCVDLQVQRSGQYARIRLENKIAIWNFYSC